MNPRQTLLTDEQLERIKQHALTSRVTKDLPPTRRCQCCNEPIIDSQLGVCCEVEEFVHIGLLYPLYFYFILYIGFFLVMASMFSLVNAHLNQEGNACGDDGSLSCRTSVTNIISELDYRDEFDTQTINNYLFIGASVLYLEIMSSLLKKKCRLMKSKQCSQSDYGVIYKNVKSSKPSEIYTEIKELEARYTTSTGKTNKIIRFVMLSNMREYSENEEKIITQGVDTVDGMLVPRVETANVLSDGVLTAANVNLIPEGSIHSDDANPKLHFSGKVIVFFMCPTKPSEFNEVDLEALTDSSDVIWENIGLKREESKKVLMLIGTGLLMSLAFLIILGLKVWIKKLSEGQHFATTTFLNLVVATVVAVFNSIEGIVIRMCARRELYGTHSKFFKIVARRLSYVFFINMVMTTFFSNLVMHLRNYSDSDKVLPLDYNGLVTDFFFLFLTNTYMSSIFNYFDLFYGYKLLKRWRVEKTRQRVSYSEEQLHFIFEGHPVDMGLRYGNIMKTLFFTAFISPFVPLGTIFSLFGLVICYWVDKYLVIRRYVMRHELSPFFAKEMVQRLIIQTEFCKFYVVLYAFSNVLLQIIPINKDDELQSSNSGLFFSIGVFVGTCMYKSVLVHIKRMIFKKKRGRQYAPSRYYDNVKQFFRNRYEDKLKVIDVANLKGENDLEVDRKLLQSVRMSTIERVIEVYP